ncbi:MAG TPA: CYTH domain-containing protein [Terrimicrobiaceae bacterium]
MAKEIERKFLLSDDSWRSGSQGCHYVQGYLSRDPERVVRVRQAGTCAFISVKGIAQGTTRQEFEYPIPLSDAEALMKLCICPLIEKTRYVVEYHGKRWEVDEFHGENEGLVLAEIEITREDEPIDLPPWIGAEVSHDARYFNANLVEHPFMRWDIQ